MKKFNICATLGFATLLGLYGLMPAESFADEPIVSSTLPDKTIIIGVHAIDLAAINDEILNVALGSVDENQSNLYYKSDLNLGTWYDISNSNSIAEISVTRENIVSATLIDELPLEYYTSPEGVTYKIEDGNEVSISQLAWFDYPSEISELAPLLVLQESKTLELETAEGDVKAQLEDELKSLSKVFAVISDANTDAFSEYITYVEVAIDALEVEGIMTFSENANLITQKVWLENRRNAYSYEVVLERLNAEISTLNASIYASLIGNYSTAVIALESGLQYLGGKNLYEIPGDASAVNARIAEMEALAAMSTEELAATVNVEDSGKTYDTLQNQALCQMIVYAKNGDNYKLLDKANELSLISSLSQGIFSSSESDNIIEEKILSDAKNLAIEVAENLSNNAEGDSRVADVVSDGSGQELVDSVYAEVAEDISDAISSASEVDDALMSVAESLEEKLAYLNETVAAIGDVLAVADDGIAEVLADVLAGNLEEIAQTQTELILADSEEYQDLQDQLAEAVAEKNIFYEEYLELLDDGNIDEAVEKREEASAAADVEQAIAGEIAAAESDTLAEQIAANNELVASQVEQENSDVDDSSVDGSGVVAGDSGAGSVGESGVGAGDSADGSVDESGVVAGDSADGSVDESGVGAGDSADGTVDESGVVAGDSGDGSVGESGVGAGDSADGSVDESGVGAGDSADGSVDESGVVAGDSGDGTVDESGVVAGDSGAGSVDESGVVAGDSGAGSVDESGTGTSTSALYSAVYFSDYGTSIYSGVVVVDDEIYLSVRSVSDCIGAKLMFDSISQTYIMHTSSGLIEFALNSKTVYVNDKKTSLKLAPNGVNSDVAYLPLSIFESAFKLTHIESGSSLRVYKY